MENLVLRQQLSVLKRRNPRRKVPTIDKLFWVLTRRIWSGWKQSLILVSPESVVERDFIMSAQQAKEYRSDR
jgi:hypothetical protein